MKEQENSKPPESNLVISEIISVRRKSEENLISKENNKEKSEPFHDSLNSFVDSYFDKKLKDEEPKSYMGLYPYKRLEISGNFGEDEDIKFEVTKFYNSTIINFEDLDYKITVSDQKIEKVSKEYEKREFNKHTICGGPPRLARPLWTELAKPEEIQKYMDFFKELEEKTDVEYNSTWYMSQLQ